MESRDIFAATLILACGTLAFPAWAQSRTEWSDIKDPQELRVLFSNKTFKGKDYLGRPFVGHFRDDGRGIGVSEGVRYPRTWAVKGNDQVCIQRGSALQCYRSQRHRVDRDRYRIVYVENDDMIYEFRVEDGIPKF